MILGRGAIIYGGSLLLHAGVALAVVRIEKPAPREATSISISEVKRAKPEQAEPPPPPPPPPPLVEQRARKVARKAPAPPPEAPAPAPAPSAAPAQPVASFGLTLSGGVGMGAGGIAVPLGNSMKAPPVQRTRTVAPKALVAKAADEKPADGCLEQLVKPKPISVPQPTYADRAREAGIQGKVRVELTVDETGQVVQAKVLESLGYGLDEAALEAARASRFEPATRCGVATRTTFVIGIRFAL